MKLALPVSELGHCSERIFTGNMREVAYSDEDAFSCGNHSKSLRRLAAKRGTDLVINDAEPCKNSTRIS